MNKKNTMVKKGWAIVMATALFASVGAFAQEQKTVVESDLTPKFGIKGGLNLTNLYVDNASDEHLKAGFNAGVYAKLPVTKGVSIQPELLYSQKGAKENYNNFIEGSGEYKFNLGYVELPVVAVFNIAKNFNLHAGGYAAYLVSANVKDVSNDGSINGAADLKADNFKRFDFGLVGGLSVDVQNFTIGARYNYGLSNIGKSGSLSGDLTKNSKNAGVSVFVGFAF
ncbi:porin family protein [Flavitalea flava]